MLAGLQRRQSDLVVREHRGIDVHRVDGRLADHRLVVVVALHVALVEVGDVHVRRAERIVRIVRARGTRRRSLAALAEALRVAHLPGAERGDAKILVPSLP